MTWGHRKRWLSSGESSSSTRTSPSPRGRAARDATIPRAASRATTARRSAWRRAAGPAISRSETRRPSSISLRAALPLPLGRGRSAARRVRRLLLGRTRRLARGPGEAAAAQPGRDGKPATSRSSAARSPRAPTLANFVARWGLSTNPDAAVAAVGKAVAAFLLSNAMSPFSSRYDDYVRGKVALTPLEARGLTLFKDAAKGLQLVPQAERPSPNPEHSLFTDYGFDAVAAPRNRGSPRPATRSTSTWGSASAPTRSARRTTALCGQLPNAVAPQRRDAHGVHAQRLLLQPAGRRRLLRDASTSPKRWYGPETFDDMPAEVPPKRERPSLRTTAARRGAGARRRGDRRNRRVPRNADGRAVSLIPIGLERNFRVTREPMAVRRRHRLKPRRSQVIAV